MSGATRDSGRIPPLAAGVRRFLLIGVGWSFVGLGMIGTVVPLLPTTPFLLLALWAFAGSSRRFHDWLYTHKLFGPLLQAWRTHRVIPLKAKALSLTAMAASMAYVLIRGDVPWWGLAAMGAVIAFGAGFILSCPSRAPAEREPN